MKEPADRTEDPSTASTAILTTSLLLALLWLGACVPRPDGEIPAGTADYGDSDNRTIYGTVTDDSGSPAAGLLLSCITDTIGAGVLMLYTDEAGAYRFEGLPSWESAGRYDVVVQTDSHWDTYERQLSQVLLHGDYGDNLHQLSIEQDLVLRSVVPGTRLTGSVRSSSGSPVPRGDVLLIYLTLDECHQGPAYNVATAEDTDYFAYDGVTGTYVIQNGLAGGAYLLNVIFRANTYATYGPESVSVSPGQTAIHNVTAPAQ